MPPRPEKLGLRRILEFVDAPKGETFFYRKRIKEECKGILQVIRTGFEDSHAFRKQSGPFMYAVADFDGNTCYVGKSLESRLSGRWLRIKGNVHHKESRDHIIAELEKGRGPLWLWGAQVEHLRPLLPPSVHSMTPKALVVALEALWIDRWLSLLWNHRREPLTPSFTDGEYWK